MPIYEYECRACEHKFEEWQKISEKPVRKCPECGKRKVKRLISSTSFKLKGSGWYVTDYARKNEGNAESDKKEASASSSTDTNAD